MLLAKWYEEFDKFLPEHSKVSELELWWNPFAQSRKCMTLKFKEQLYVMKMKNNTKIEEEMSCCFKIEWGTSQILTRALKSLKNLCFNWLLVTKVYIVWATKVQRSYLCDLQFEKRLEKFGKFSPEHFLSNFGSWSHSFAQSNWDWKNENIYLKINIFILNFSFIKQTTTWIFGPLLPLYSNQSTDLQSKSMGRFLYNGKTRLK